MAALMLWLTCCGLMGVVSVALSFLSPRGRCRGALRYSRMTNQQQSPTLKDFARKMHSVRYGHLEVPGADFGFVGHFLTCLPLVGSQFAKGGLILGTPAWLIAIAISP